MQFNNAFFDQLGRSAGVTALTLEAAERVAETARESAPVKSGAYKASIKVKLKYQSRAVALVVATDPKTMLIEAKTGNLARAVKKAGRRG